MSDFESLIDVGAVPYPPINTSEQRYLYLKCLERDFPVKIVKYGDINEKMMTILFDWCLAVVYNMEMDPIFSLVSHIVWRFLEKEPQLSRTKLQRLGVTAIFIAAKREYDSPYTTKAGEFIEYTAGDVSFSQLVEMEREIAEKLEFCLVFATVDRCIAELTDRYQIKEFSKLAFIEYLKNLSIVMCLFPKYSSFIVAEVCVSVACPGVIKITNIEQFNQCQKELKTLFEEKNPRYDAAKRVFIKRYERELPNELTLISEDDLKNSCCRSLAVEFNCEDRKPERSDRKYKEKQKLGQGTFGTVDSMEVEDSKETYARKKNISEEGIHETVIQEISLMQFLNHPNILRIADPIINLTSDVNSMPISEVDFYMKMMTPFDKLIHGPMTFDQVKKYGRQLLEGVKYLCDRDVMHRDLKPQNLLVDQDGTLKIADFGIATMVKTDQPQKYSYTAFTRWYSPPEVLSEIMYDKKADLWSVGCILAEMASGEMLFPGNDNQEILMMIFREGNPDRVFDLEMNPSTETFEKVILDNPRFLPSKFEMNHHESWPSKDWALFKDLLSKLLAPDPRFRFSAAEALNHEFFSNVSAAEVTEIRQQFEELKIGGPLDAIREEKEEEKEETLQQRLNDINKDLQTHLGFQLNFGDISDDLEGATKAVRVFLGDTGKSKFDKMVIMWEFYRFLQIAMEYLNDPTFKRSIRLKCLEFEKSGLYVGHFIGIEQDKSTTSIEDIKALIK